MWNYSNEVRKHYLDPHNVGEVENPDGVGEVGNLKCGDALRLTFKLDEDKKIKDIKFKTFGCGSAIASSSVLTDLCIGKTLDDAKKITNKDIADALGGLPPAKMHCSVMGQEALEAAIRFYETGGKETQPQEKEGTIVCTCFSVTDKEIEKAIKDNNLKTVEEVTDYTKAGGGCGGCIGEIENILNRINNDGAPAEPTVKKAEPAPMTNLQKIEKIKEVLASEVAPILAKDGGGCELVDVDGNDVYVTLTGHCASCAFSKITQQSIVGDILKKKISEDLNVKEPK